MKMVDKSSKLDKFSANMNASTSAGVGGGGGGSGGSSVGGVGNTGASGGGLNTGHGVSNVSGHYYHTMQQQLQQQQHHGSSSHHQNGQKPVPMKLFAAWEVDRTPPNCIPRAKKEATTSAQYELLVSEMEKHPDVASGLLNFGSTKSIVENVWEETAKLLNAIGPPIRTSQKWRKVWTDYRGRLKKKFSMNEASIRQTCGEPSELSEFTPIEREVESVVKTSVAEYPSGAVYGVKVETNECTNEPPQLVSNDYPELPQVSSYLPPKNAPIVEESSWDVNEIPPKPQCSSHKHTFNSKKRRQIAKDEERKKLIRLTEEHTAAIARQTAALEKLTTAIEIQNKLLQEKFK